MPGICRIARSSILSIATLAFISCQQGRAETTKPAKVTSLKGLAEKIAKLPLGSDPATLQPPKDAKITVERHGWMLIFQEPIDAAVLAREFGWTRPYAISGDVHQRSWEIEIFVTDLTDPYNRRISTAQPRVGPWLVRASLVGRPEGPVPALVSGASPAYDLTRYAAKVSRVGFTKAP